MNYIFKNFILVTENMYQFPENIYDDGVRFINNKVSINQQSEG